MNVLDALMLVIWIVLALAAVVTIARMNFVVSPYRKRVIDHIFNASMRDLADGRGSDWTLSYDIMDKVSFDKMVFQLWRKPETFFPPEYRPAEGEQRMTDDEVTELLSNAIAIKTAARLSRSSQTASLPKDRLN